MRCPAQFAFAAPSAGAKCGTGHHTLAGAFVGSQDRVGLPDDPGLAAQFARRATDGSMREARRAGR
ncbi:hypothetical protein SBA4_630001 [Candidatus Sulfopaludibacter sp. SbA4]|nr:hypothetical protein SBA4_630001 [Candidatus Sulfopaludibacter sp. SbA4]